MHIGTVRCTQTYWHKQIDTNRLGQEHRQTNPRIHSQADWHKQKYTGRLSKAIMHGHTDARRHAEVDWHMRNGLLTLKLEDIQNRTIKFKLFKLHPHYRQIDIGSRPRQSALCGPI